MEKIEIEIRLAETNVTIRKKTFVKPGPKLLLWITKEQLEAAQQGHAQGRGEAPADDPFDQIVEDTIYGDGA